MLTSKDTEVQELSHKDNYHADIYLESKEKIYNLNTRDFVEIYQTNVQKQDVWLSNNQ